MKKKKVDPVAYAAKVRKEAEKMEAMSETFGSHTKTPIEPTARRVRKSSGKSS